MRNHLTEDQFARCGAGQGERAELEHLRECTGCAAELDDFKTGLGRFRTALRQRVDDRLASRPLHLGAARAPRAIRVPLWRWGVVFASVIALLLPFFTTVSKKPEGAQPGIETNANAIMDAVNRHLSRSVPAPMEPAFSLIPTEEFITEPGGVQ